MSNLVLFNFTGESVSHLTEEKGDMRTLMPSAAQPATVVFDRSKAINASTVIDHCRCVPLRYIQQHCVKPTLPPRKEGVVLIVPAHIMLMCPDREDLAICATFNEELAIPFLVMNDPRLKEA